MSRRLRICRLIGVVALAALIAACDNSDHSTAAPTATAAWTVTPVHTSTPSATTTSTSTATPPPPTATATATATPSASPTDTQVPLTSAAVLAAGPFGVGVTTIAFVDVSRPTMPNGIYPGAPERRLVTEVWYPAAPRDGAPAEGQRDAALDPAGAPYPLVMYSHGFMDRRTSGGFLARHLASHGYVVASPDFPLSNFNAPGRPTVNDVPDQPLDVRFLIDQILALSAQPDGPWSGAVDGTRIGLAGLSLGGLTTTLTALHPALRDPRVRAAAPVAGPGCFFGPAFVGDRSVPLLIVHGDIDAIVPYRENAVALFDVANAPAYLVTVHGASHTAFSELGAQLGGNNPDDIGCQALGGSLPRPGPDAMDLLDRLGGEEAGIVPGDCPEACADPTPRPTALRGPRQLELTVLAVFPFFEAHLRADAAMREFLETTLPAENAEIAIAPK